MSAQSSLNLDGKTVLVTGGTGTVGSVVVSTLLSECAKVKVFSRDQNKQFKMNYKHASKRIEFVNGDICDSSILSRAVKGSDCVVHCAAAKHVPLCESNADTAIKVNVEGTRNVLNECARWGVERFIMLSTDKAVNPTSVMGATKFLAERLTLEYSKILKCAVVRLGNVFASNGSVVPTFLDRIKYKLPIVVNNPSAVRYFIAKRDAGKFIVDRLKDMENGDIYIKKMKVMTIMALAEAMKPDVGYEVRIGELSQGEKIKEMLITQEESRRALDCGDYITVSPAQLSVEVINPKVEFFTKEEILELLRGIHA